MRTIYLNEKKKLNKRRIKKITKRLDRIAQKEEIVLAISKDLCESEELINEISKLKIEILDRQMDF